MKTTISLIALCTSLLLLAGCGGKNKGMEPEDVVIAFNKAMASCDFEQAAKLCNAENLQAYIASCKEVYDSNIKKDKKVTDSAVETLSKVETTIGEITKERGIRTITYTLQDSFGSSKEKTAVLKEVEGEWLIDEIKDRQ